MTGDVDFSNSSEFIAHYGLAKVMTDLLKEELDAESPENSVLYSKYKEAVETGNDNEYFVFMFRLKDDMAVKLTEHINIYHIVKDLSLSNEPIVPWFYADSKNYVADAWWEEDNNIIYDLQNMPFVEFLVKYKGY